MITVHHLNFSRSTRVLWLMAELGVEYQLVRHERDQNFRAPASLKAVHPLGKAPVLQDDDLTIAESASILAYVNTRYGDGRLAPATGTVEAAVHDEWLQYVESSAAFPIMMTLIGGMTGGLPVKLAGFAQDGVARTLDFIASRLGNGAYLMGDELMIADIQMGYMVAIADYAGLLGDRRILSAYLGQLMARPALAEALEVGGPMVPPSRG